jgi:hypothetical protein
MDVVPLALFAAIESDVNAFRAGQQGPVGGDAPTRDVQLFACDALLSALLKKWECQNETTDKAALDSFLHANEKCGEWVNPVSRSDITLSDEQLLCQFLKEFEDFFLTYWGPELDISYHSILEKGKTGPGAALGATAYDFYSKLFSSELTVTSPNLYELYSHYTWLYPEWATAEQIRVSHYGQYKIVRSSSVSCVPKNDKTSRLICTEPSLNMFFQQGIGEIITGRLKRVFGIDLASQPTVNRLMARLGSISDGDSRSRADGFVTVDLKSASDSISLQLLNWCMPPEWLSAILETRSSYAKLPDGRLVSLNMCSTMGNGFTFALQTALFACCVSAVMKFNRGETPFASYDERANFSVFGDDIIIKEKYWSWLRRLLDLLGFTVNADKTFSQGPFRESCGGDYYRGHNVRGVFIKRLDTAQDYSVAINLLNEWSARTGVPLPQGVGYLVNRLYKRWRWVPLVPFAENNDSGIRVPYALLKRVKRDPGSGAIIYDRYIPRPRLTKISDGTVKVPRGAKKAIYNPPGLLMAYLNGTVREGCITNRSIGEVQYTRRKGITPFWDWSPQSDGERIGLSIRTFTWRRWRTAVEVNLLNYFNTEE